MKKLNILHIEDNFAHLELFSEAVKNSGIDADVSPAINGHRGKEAIFAGKYDLIILDINLPDMSGLDVLRIIKKSSNPIVRRIPVVILTTSPVLEDIYTSYDLHAAAYIIKPVRYTEFRKAVSSMLKFYSYVIL